MRRKDYLKLVKVFNRKEVEREATGGSETTVAGAVYFTLLKRLIITLKGDNPRFNADKFMQALE